MKPQTEIHERGDGFWAGRELKNGSLGKGSHKISDEEIMTMFTRLFEEYCRTKGTDKMLMRDASGQLFVVGRVKKKDE